MSGDLLREAGITLADRALLASGGEQEAARVMLQGPLEAIGLIPYPSGAEAGVKTCTACGKPKPVGEFAKNSRSADGHSSRCKACKNGRTP